MAMAEDGGGVYVGEKVSRQGDMGEGLKLEILREEDGDLIVSIMGVHDRFSPDHAIQFCVPGTGGGSSRHTFKALQDLRVAMALDEQERKQPVPDRSINVVLSNLNDERPNYGGVVIPREAMQAAFLKFNERLSAAGGLRVELGTPKPDLFEKPGDYARRIVSTVDETKVCGKLEAIRIEGNQVVAKFTKTGPMAHVLTDLSYPKDYVFGIRYLSGIDGEGKKTFVGPMTWSVVAPER
ncbi:hypothetical protein [Xanthomonas phage RTH11]|nr:hypothetical protein [Xanthomonas phage RTH11]